jgi:hypothetical protein
MSTTPPEDPWYRDGLRFACTRCGACCTGAPGYVWVDADEIARIAAHRDESPEQFSGRFVRRVGNRYSLVERPGGDCIFWSREAGCTVYDARPAQCRTWPFWPENIADAESWGRTARACPGSGSEGGRLFTVEEIRATAAKVHTP